MRTRKIFFIILPLIFCLCSANSLWKDDYDSPYAKNRNYKIGDTVTVLIEENLSAIQTGTTRSDKRSDLGIDIGVDDTSSFTSGSKATSSEGSSEFTLDAGGNSRFQGTGRTSRTSALEAIITATIIDIQPNGNLFILGQRQMKVNDEIEQVEVSGIVRGEDISEQNTVRSSQIANAKISVKGSGVVSNPQRPGMMTKMFGWLF